ncbi:unnamed protein product [Schistocephalus solidus]|uniref:Uncharacterized protein n=1 Tax=Schistocephalus solidus TaxID=70667 RepID=A0A183T1R4_SCHSO|nr:unnamed protein product [Schistocephalus solidus]
MRPTGSPPPRPKKRHKSHQCPGLTPPMLRPCQHSRARISLVGNLRAQCNNNPTIPTSTSNSAIPPSDSHILTPGIDSITPTIIETTSLYSSPVTPTTAPTTAFAFTTTTTTTPPAMGILF